MLTANSRYVVNVIYFERLPADQITPVISMLSDLSIPFEKAGNLSVKSYVLSGHQSASRGLCMERNVETK